MEELAAAIARGREGARRGGGGARVCSRTAASFRSSIGGWRPRGKPWVAAINGTAVGGGFELCLACHHRVAAESEKTRVGLPEVKIGLFPGAGGTTRIARLLAPADALQMLLKGEQPKVARAKALKLIDALVPADELVSAAKDWIKAGGKPQAPWDAPGFKLPGGPVYSKAGMMTFPAANALYRRETYDNYPAARAILTGGLRGAAAAVRPGADRGIALLRQGSAFAGGGGHDPLAVRVDAGSGQGRAPACRRSAGDG